MSIFLKENRILLLTEELDLASRVELHECLRRFVNIGFECRHFHGNFTISHVGHYPDLVSIAAHVIVEGLDQSVLHEDVVYAFPQDGSQAQQGLFSPLFVPSPFPWLWFC